MRGSNSGHKPEVSVLHWTPPPAAAEGRNLCQQSKTTRGVPCFYSSLFCFVFSLPWDVWPWHDSQARLLQWSGCPVLKKDLSHYKQKWRGQSNCCSWELYVNARQCAVWTLRTGGWCWDLGTYKRSLESSHCCSYRETHFTVSRLSEFFCF